MKRLSRLITSDGEFKAWIQPELEGAAPPLQPQQPRKSESPEAIRKALEQELESLRESARRDGFLKGHTEGVAKGQAEVRERAARFEALADALAAPLQQLDPQVEEELVKLALAVARQIVRRELKSDPAQVIGVVKEALNALPMASQTIRLQLHPDDARLVAETMLVNVSERKWALVENPVMQRGGCRIETDSASVDATIESRVAAIAARIMGGERSDDRQ